jgi:hypothetical protein
MDDLRLHIRDFRMYVSMCLTVRTDDIEMYLRIGGASDRDAVFIHFSLTLLAEVLCDSRIDDSFEYRVEHRGWYEIIQGFFLFF